MNIENYQNKCLKKAYHKSMKSLTNQLFQHKHAGLFFFINYLRYIRDTLVIGNINDSEQTKLNTIITAIAEFDAYVECLKTKNLKQKTFHWETFCELVKQNMEEWLDLNDSI